MADGDILDELLDRLHREFQKVEKEIDARQKEIRQTLKKVKSTREDLAAERAQLDDENRALEQQQADLDSGLAELSALKSQMNGEAAAAKKGGWCCCAKPETGNLDVTGEVTMGTVDALQAVRVCGAGSMDANGIYLKTVMQGNTLFVKADDGKVLYYQYGAGLGLRDGWYIAECFQGSALYLREHQDELTLPFQGFDIAPVQGCAPGDHPPPVLEPAEG